MDESADEPARRREPAGSGEQTLPLIAEQDRAGLPVSQPAGEDEQYRSIFEAATDAMAIVDLDGYLVEVNPAACEMYGYTREEMIGMHGSLLLHPDYKDATAETFRLALQGGSARAQTVGVRKDGSLFHAEGRATAFMFRGTLHLLTAGQDVTERVEAERRLREKEEQYRRVFEVTMDGLALISLDGRFVEANAAYCRIHGYSEDEMVGMEVARVVHPDDLPVLAQGLEAATEGKPTHLQFTAVRKDGSSFPAEGWSTALMYRGEPHLLGVLRDITERINTYERLEQRVEERTRELATVLDIANNLASTAELGPLLDLILDQIKTVIDYTGAAVVVLEDDGLEVMRSRGPAEHPPPRTRFPFERWPAWNLIEHGSALLIDDVRGNSVDAGVYRAAVGGQPDGDSRHVTSYLAVPMKLKNRVVGALALSHTKKGFFTGRHASLAAAIANGVAVAIENARLYERAQEAAVLEERQRLSRELHDSVSQALYSIVLGTKTARAWLERDVQRVAEPLEYVLAQAELGLAEMRALIFELRPETLANEGLVAALEKQVESVQRRYRLTVNAALGSEPDAPLPVKEALYRVAQEALHNTVKHAQASEAWLRLQRSGRVVTLDVGDNGVGFDPGKSYPGHFGLRSMEERAARLGGSLQVESTAGKGTRVLLRIPC